MNSLRGVTIEGLVNVAYGAGRAVGVSVRTDEQVAAHAALMDEAHRRDAAAQRTWPTGEQAAEQAAEQLARAVNEVRDAEGVRDGARSYPWESLTERERKLGLKRAAEVLARLNDAPQSQPSAAQAFAEIRDEFGHHFDGVTDADMREWRGHAPEGGVDAET